MHTPRVFRLFVSSTFSDFIAEREALQQKVFPKLERYCAERGASFQALDLRWGITEEAQYKHDTMRICLEEVRRCQQLSPRPNFAVLLGDRYGWEPVPARIAQDHWIRLRKAASISDWILIEDSYICDENAIPPVHCLRNTLNNSPAVFVHEALLLNALRRAARSFRGKARLPYFASATHQEIAIGALSRHDEHIDPLVPEQHVHVYVRHLSGLTLDESAKDFIDWDAKEKRVVAGARDRLRGLDAQLRGQLGDHVHDLHTSWNHHGRNGAVSKAYLERFCTAFLEHQKQLIDAELASVEKIDEMQYRKNAHQEFGTERARVFVGRKSLLARVARYTAPKLQSREAQPIGRTNGLLFLLGGGGSGKSALLARAAQQDLEQSKQTGAVIFQRYIGGVPGTESLMTTLTALTADIASVYGKSQLIVPENSKALAKAFQTVLGYPSADRPLIMYLDALDQLDSADGAWMLEWLPEKLPANVRLVASARTDTSVEKSARRRYPRSLIEVPRMKPIEGRAMLKAWLADKRAAWFNAGIAPTIGRRLTAKQQQVVLDAFNKNGSALWLKLAYQEAAIWASWDAPRQLPITVQGMIEDLVEQRLFKHENHSKVFTEQALAYLTASRFGLSESELSRAIGTDPAVRAEFRSNEKTQRRWEDDKTLPPILWSRLYFDLQPYLGLAHVDNALVMRWFHREFWEVLKSRYLRTTSDRNAIHGTLADTFQTLERELRPKDKNDERLFRSTEASSQQVSAALRRVMEQPWQLARAERHEDLQTLLTDFGFCMGKCAANRVDDLISDLIPTQSSGAHLLPWYRHLIVWRHRLRHGDILWPAHRILIQLTGESAEFSECLESEVYGPYVSSTYFSNQQMKIEELCLRRVTQVNKLPLTKQTDFLLYDNRWLLGIDVMGVGTMIDIERDLVIGVAPIEPLNKSDLQKAKIFSVQASSVMHLRKTVKSDTKSVFDLATKFPGVLRIHKCELVLGDGHVDYLGIVGNESMFACDGQLVLINVDRLTKQGVALGCFSVEGYRINTLEGMSWDYSRFGINVFLNEETLLSLGWESTSMRDEIKAEIWDLEVSGIKRRSEITFNDGLDFPLAVLGVLEDGRVVFTGENYRRSYVIDPNGPSDDSLNLWPVVWSWADPEKLHTGCSNNSVASEWLWLKQTENELAKPSDNLFKGLHVDHYRYWVRIGARSVYGPGLEGVDFEEFALRHNASFLDEGSTVLWDKMHEIEDIGEGNELSWEETPGRLIKWFSDVTIKCAAFVDHQKIVLVKRSGPVVLRKGLRS